MSRLTSYSSLSRAALITALAVAVSLTSATRALAQSDARAAQAEAIYQQALKLHDADHEVEALEKFREAYALYPSPNILVAIAREEQLLGRAADALRHYREALKNPHIGQVFARLARRYLAELEAASRIAMTSAP